MLALPNPAQAQQRGWSFQGRAGLAVPAADLADFQDPGPSLGVGLAYWIRDRLAVRADAGVDLLSGAETDFGGEFGNITLLYHYDARVEYDLIPPSQSPWKLHANAGLGATTLDREVGESETDFTLNAGARLGYQVSPRVRVFGGPQAYVILGVGANDETFLSFPIDAGVRVLLTR